MKSSIRVLSFVLTLTLALSVLSCVTFAASTDYPTLRKGSSGEPVGILQDMLVSLGYNLSIDEIFGSKTLAAVKDFQETRGLTCDGIVGRKTWAALEAAVEEADDGDGKSLWLSSSTMIPTEIFECQQDTALSGKIRGTSQLGKVIIGVYDEAGHKVFALSQKVKNKTFDLAEFSKAFDLASLEPDTYIFQIRVVNDINGDVTLYDEELEVLDFYVDSDFADTESVILKLSVKAHGKEKISDHFKVSEFACSDGSDTILVDRKLIAGLEEIRIQFDAPVTISSGYRSPEYNSTLENAKSKSKHTLGMAADILVKGYSPYEVAAFAEELGFLGIGRYTTSDWFTHVDTRTTRYFWREHAGYTMRTFQ